MKTILGILLSAIFAILSLLHVYWAAGGRFASIAAIPTVDGKPLFRPSMSATLLVAAALFAAMLTILGNLGLFGEQIPRWIFRWTTFLIALLFLLRAIGDFKLLGFFKQINDTGFAYWDTVLFSPLCLFIAVVAFLINFRK
jgi:hypothetical protein